MDPTVVGEAWVGPIVQHRPVLRHTVLLRKSDNRIHDRYGHESGPIPVTSQRQTRHCRYCRHHGARTTTKAAADDTLESTRPESTVLNGPVDLVLLLDLDDLLDLDLVEHVSLVL